MRTHAFLAGSNIVLGMPVFVHALVRGDWAAACVCAAVMTASVGMHATHTHGKRPAAFAAWSQTLLNVNRSVATAAAAWWLRRAYTQPLMLTQTDAHLLVAGMAAGVAANVLSEICTQTVLHAVLRVAWHAGAYWALGIIVA